MRIAKFVAVLVTCAPLLVQGASVWKVSGKGQTLYLGGTLHMLSKNDFPLPPGYEDAYAQADTVVFETDIGALETPEFAAKSMEVLTYTNGQSLQDALSAKTFSLLQHHLQSRGFPVERFLPFKPAMVAVTLSMIEFSRMGMTSQGVDKFFYEKAMAENKQTEWFETPEEQLAFIASMGEGDADAFITYTLEDIKTLPDQIDVLKDAWKNGDMTAMYENTMKDFSTDYPAVYQKLLVDRNEAWLPQIQAMLDTPATEFVLVGTMHLAGSDGLIILLEKQGFTVTQL